MEEGLSKVGQETEELPIVAADPVLAHLRRAEEQYRDFRESWDTLERDLQDAHSQIEELVSTKAGLEDSLRAGNEKVEQHSKRLNEAQGRLTDLQGRVNALQQELDQARDQEEQERQSSVMYRDRAVQLGDNLKQIHRALYEGNVYSLILKACLTITGATRGLYITVRGDIDTLRIRAAQDIDGYPATPPSDFIKAVCQKVLEDNQSFVCNSEAELEEMPKPERADEHFQNLVASPAVLLHNLNGIVIAADKLNGDFDQDDVDTLLSVGDRASVAVENRMLQRELQNSYIGTVSILADAVEAKDPYTHGHCDLVSRYARLTAEKMELPAEERSIICYAALLHDVGKIGVSDGVLNKPGPLLPEERALMRSHVRVGHDLISRVPALTPVADVVLHHHEWWDGSGYPDGLREEEIPMAARIICVVDAYCAMITKRSYKEAYSVDRAREELKRCAGSQFDAQVVKAFLEVLDTPEAETIDEEESACPVLPNFTSYQAWQQSIQH